MSEIQAQILKPKDQKQPSDELNKLTNAQEFVIQKTLQKIKDDMIKNINETIAKKFEKVNKTLNDITENLYKIKGDITDQKQSKININEIIEDTVREQFGKSKKQILHKINNLNKEVLKLTEKVEQIEIQKQAPFIELVSELEMIKNEIQSLKDKTKDFSSILDDFVF
jgi:CHAD domain-containing protein